MRYAQYEAAKEEIQKIPSGEVSYSQMEAHGSSSQFFVGRVSKRAVVSPG